jgi:thioesterase domain-containing protein
MREQPPPAWTSLVPIQPGGPRPPLFGVHWAGGEVDFYHDLARHLGPDQPLYGLQALGVDRQRPPHTSIRDMAAHYLTEVRSLQPQGPYFLTGASLGGKVAYEMAQLLHDQGQRVGLLALLDTILEKRDLSLKQRLQLHSGKVDTTDRASVVAYGLGRAWIRVRRTFLRTGYRLEIPWPRSMWDLVETTIYAAQNYRPAPYVGDAILFRATLRDPRGRQGLFLGWERLVLGGIEVIEIPGEHSSLVREPGVAVVASILRERIDQALGST